MSTVIVSIDDKYDSYQDAQNRVFIVQSFIDIILKLGGWVKHENRTSFRGGYGELSAMVTGTKMRLNLKNN